MEETEQRTKVLKNGAIYDLDKKQIVANPGGGLAAFTPDTSAAARSIKAQKKREAVLRGAARTLNRTDDWTNSNDLDVVEAIAEAVMMKALNPDNAKQVDAARFLLQESGMSETLAQASTTHQQSDDLHVLLMQLATIAQAINNSTTRHDEQVIDA
jgi:hypothetical protein